MMRAGRGLVEQSSAAGAPDAGAAAPADAAGSGPAGGIREELSGAAAMVEDEVAASGVEAAAEDPTAASSVAVVEEEDLAARGLCHTPRRKT